jgi:hypothetical protein
MNETCIPRNVDHGDVVSTEVSACECLSPSRPPTRVAEEDPQRSSWVPLFLVFFPRGLAPVVSLEGQFPLMAFTPPPRSIGLIVPFLS